MHLLLDKIQEAIHNRVPFAICTVVTSAGSTPLKTGAKMLVWANGDSAGTIGGGNLENQVITDAVKHIQEGTSECREYHLLQQKMCCGGTMTIFIDYIKPQRQLIIFGAGHIGCRVAEYTRSLGFQVVVADERKLHLSKIDHPGINKINSSHQKAFERLTFDRDTFVLICTHLHEYDREILIHCIHQPLAYLGMIGSQRKVLITRKKFLENQVCTPEELDRVDMPVGFDLGQNGPDEIAFGIAAKILSVANGKNIFPAANTKTYEEAIGDSNGCR